MICGRLRDSSDLHSYILQLRDRNNSILYRSAEYFVRRINGNVSFVGF